MAASPSSFSSQSRALHSEYLFLFNDMTWLHTPQTSSSGLPKRQSSARASVPGASCDNARGTCLHFVAQRYVAFAPPRWPRHNKSNRHGRQTSRETARTLSHLSMPSCHSFDQKTNCLNTFGWVDETRSLILIGISENSNLNCRPIEPHGTDEGG